MQNSYLHNNKSLDEDLDQAKISQRKYIDKKKVVDINKLLNRVKVNKIKEKKKNVTFILSTISCLSITAYIIFS
tara:strand:+ start:881 stop:1102 length:222 start_codon:yes stop_codon:yes gene_type:complete